MVRPVHANQEIRARPEFHDAAPGEQDGTVAKDRRLCGPVDIRPPEQDRTRTGNERDGFPPIHGMGPPVLRPLRAHPLPAGRDRREDGSHEQRQSDEMPVTGTLCAHVCVFLIE